MILLVGFFVLVGRLLMALLLGLFYLARFLIHHPRAVAVLIVAGGVAWMAWPAFPAFADVPFPLLVGLGVAGGLVGLTVVVRGVLSDWNYERYLQGEARRDAAAADVSRETAATAPLPTTGGPA
jgi:hypothetical protein